MFLIWSTMILLPFDAAPNSFCAIWDTSFAASVQDILTYDQNFLIKHFFLFSYKTHDSILLVFSHICCLNLLSKSINHSLLHQQLFLLSWVSSTLYRLYQLHKIMSLSVKNTRTVFSLTFFSIYPKLYE